MISSIIDVVLLTALAATSVSVLLMYRRLKRFDVLQGDAAREFARTADALDKARTAFGSLQSDGDHMTVALSAKLNEARLLLNDMEDAIAAGANAARAAKDQADAIRTATPPGHSAHTFDPLSEEKAAMDCVLNAAQTRPGETHATPLGEPGLDQAGRSLADRLKSAAWGPAPTSREDAARGVYTTSPAPSPAPVAPMPGDGATPPVAPPLPEPVPAPMQASTAVQAARAKLCGTSSGPSWRSHARSPSAPAAAVRTVDWTVLAEAARPNA